MITTITHTYRRMPKLGRFFLWIAFVLGLFVGSFKIYADSIPFEDTLPGMFGWLNTGYYSNTHFHFGGNDFVGIIFWQTGLTLSTPQQITINGGAQAINCSTQLRGIYYNNQRGWRIRPLDTGNLAILSGNGVGYDTMTLTNGFFTNCTALSGGYTPPTNAVYGQIDHTLGTQTFSMIAGVDYDFSTNDINGASFSGSLLIGTGGIHNGFLFDTEGGIAELSMNMPRCGMFTITPDTFSGGTNTSFICEGNSVAGYKLEIFDGISPTAIYGNLTGNTSSLQRWHTGSALAPGNYTAQCIVLLSGGGGIQCGDLPFQVTGTGTTPPSGTGCNPNFQGEISFSALTSGQLVYSPSLGSYYTNKTGVVIQRAATEPNATYISGDFVSSPITSAYTGNDIFNDIVYHDITLNTINNWNHFFSTYTATGSTGTCTYIDANKRVYVDMLPPTAPNILIPASGSSFCPSTPMTITRSPATDTGAGLAYYTYEVYNNTGMTTSGLMLSGIIPNTTTGMNLNISLLPFGTYYLRIIAVDHVGLTTASSNTVTFITHSQYCSVSTGVVIVTPVIRLRNVDLQKVYRSDPIWILGLTGPTLVSIDRGMLFVNNSTGVGTTGIITSNDTLYIEMISSDSYDTTITSKISIVGLTGEFKLTTKKSNCSLTVAERLIIENIYEDLKDEYNGNITLFSQFLTTFQSMVEDEGELSPNCSLEYLLSLIDGEFDSDQGIDTSNHICPNCKEYSIAYDYTEHAYYAPEMMNRYYFINRESLIRHLDYYNPGDCHVNTYRNNAWTTTNNDPLLHVAPNGKLYHFIEQYGGFTAKEFTAARYFDSLDNIIRYIDLRNPPKTIRDHNLDTTFIPMVYAAPNSKEYKIRKAINLGYFSYRLMKVQYFNSLGELKNYIDKRNPGKR